jgi:hypothetical protein
MYAAGKTFLTTDAHGSTQRGLRRNHKGLPDQVWPSHVWPWHKQEKLRISTEANEGNEAGNELPPVQLAKISGFELNTYG